tara:strand:- start:2289 stop:2501 length:213 start_codon:yes stop_codon:yes gene_type:complete
MAMQAAAGARRRVRLVAAARFAPGNEGSGVDPGGLFGAGGADRGGGKEGGGALRRRPRVSLGPIFSDQRL